MRSRREEGGGQSTTSHTVAVESNERRFAGTSTWGFRVAQGSGSLSYEYVSYLLVHTAYYHSLPVIYFQSYYRGSDSRDSLARARERGSSSSRERGVGSRETSESKTIVRTRT